MSTTPSPRTIAVTSGDLFTAVAEAGAEWYEWYHSYVIDDEAGTLTVAIDTGEGDYDAPTLRRCRLKAADMRRAIDALAAKYPDAVGGDIAAECRSGDPDIDCEMADAVIQFAVLGDIVWG